MTHPWNADHTSGAIPSTDSADRANPESSANHPEAPDRDRATAKASAVGASASSQPQRRRGATSAKGWIPDQPGAWVMALSPALAGVVTGAVLGRPTADACWLLVCWALCYCVEFTAGRWLKAHGSRRYLKPMLVYCLALAAVGLPFVVLHPGVLAWAPIYMVLLAADCMASWWRRERTLWANAVAVTAACLMPMLTVVYGLDSPEVPYVSLPGLALAVCFAAVQFGSVLFVKTMIREWGKRRYVVASWLWHAALFAWWVVTPTPWLAALAAVLLARAAALPLVGRRRRPKPVVVGAVEAMCSMLAFVCIVAQTV